MAFTRFYDDSYRIEKRLDLSTFEGRYQLDRPGPGLDLPFMEDPQLRLQRFGANIHSNSVNLESDLRGMTRKLNRDYGDLNNFQEHQVKTQPSTVLQFSRTFCRRVTCQSPSLDVSRCGTEPMGTTLVGSSGEFRETFSYQCTNTNFETQRGNLMREPKGPLTAPSVPRFAYGIGNPPCTPRSAGGYTSPKSPGSA